MADCDHAPLAPSSAARLVACSGSRKMAALFPQEETIESREGTAAHWAASELLNGRVVDVGQVAGNGVTLTEEMVEAAELYAEHIVARGPVGAVEQLVKSAAIHPDNYGTPDHFALQPMHLFIDDFKFGHGYVEVFENWQLMNYAALILQEMGINGQADQLLRVTMTIIQPRNYHRDGPIRSWSVMASELRGFFNIMAGKFEEAMRDDAPVTAGTHCEHCPGRFACEAITASAYNAVSHAYSSVPLALSPDGMGLELRTLRRAAKMLGARITGLEEQVLATIAHGKSVPFFSIERAQGRTKWTAPVAEVIALGEILGVNVSKPDVMTPKQAIKQGLPAEVVAKYSDTPRGVAELVEDDGRAASKIFK